MNYCPIKGKCTHILYVPAGYQPLQHSAFLISGDFNHVRLDNDFLFPNCLLSYCRLTSAGKQLCGVRSLRRIHLGLDMIDPPCLESEGVRGGVATGNFPLVYTWSILPPGKQHVNGQNAKLKASKWLSTNQWLTLWSSSYYVFVLNEVCVFVIVCSLLQAIAG